MGTLARMTELKLEDFALFLFVGFFAQLTDAALGMGFGVISSSVLLFQGVSPPVVSAAVNAAKIPTGSAASLSHWRHGNIDRSVLISLAISGAIGGITGALLLASLKGFYLNSLIAGYLLILGSLVILRGVLGRAPRVLPSKKLGLIGSAGGLIEGIGGSWGPVVTTGLLGTGVEPRRAIGSSAVAELVVSITVLVSITLALSSQHIGEAHDITGLIGPIAGLVCGGVPAAFFGGHIAKIAPRRPLTIAVGVLALGIGIYRTIALI